MNSISYPDPLKSAPFVRSSVFLDFRDGSKNVAFLTHCIIYDPPGLSRPGYDYGVRGVW